MPTPRGGGSTENGRLDMRKSIVGRVKGRDGHVATDSMAAIHDHPEPDASTLIAALSDKGHFTLVALNSCKLVSKYEML